MRRALISLTVLLVAVGSSAATTAPAVAAPPAAPIYASGSAAIEPVRDWHRRDRGDDWRHHHRRRHRHDGFYPQFYFPFPFYLPPQHHRHHPRRGCYRAWNGYIYCD